MKEEEVIKRTLEKLAKVKDIAPPLEARALAVAAAWDLRADADSLGLRILREGKRWQRRLLQGVCQALGIALPPKVEERLEDGKTWTVVSGRFGERWPEAHLRLLVDGVAVFSQSFRLRQGRRLGGLSFSTWPGGARVRTRRGLYARKGHVYKKRGGVGET